MLLFLISAPAILVYYGGHRGCRDTSGGDISLLLGYNDSLGMTRIGTLIYNSCLLKGGSCDSKSNKISWFKNMVMLCYQFTIDKIECIMYMKGNTWTIMPLKSFLFTKKFHADWAMRNLEKYFKKC